MNLSTLQGVKRLSTGKQRFVQKFVMALGMILVVTALTFAQGTRGTIRGKVVDPNGAVVAGASARLTDVTKGTERGTVQTDESGEYQFLEVEPSTYSIVISAAGFSETNLTEIKVEPNRNLQLDVTLNIGGTTEVVEVTGTQELLDRESATIGTTVQIERVLGLPLNGRNVLDLALGQPGVVPAAGGAGFRVNGSRSVENNITLDGGNNNEVAIGSSTGAQPRPDAVQEFRLLTSNYDAEFGRNAGSVVNVVTKSGTNEFHGNARMFYRPTVLSAARFFDKALPTSAPRIGTKDDFRRRFERKEFGGNIGGPIYLPRFGEGGPSLLSGKNKAFFFIDYEGRRQLIGDTRVITNLPTNDERNGIFTRSPPSTCAPLSPPCPPIPLLDPASGAPFPLISGTIAPGQTIRQQIPSSRFSPIAGYYIPFLPATANGSASAGANEITNFDQLTSRADFLIGDNHNVNFSFSYFDQAQDSPFAFQGASVPGFGADNLRTTYNYVVRHTYTISPRLVNSLLLNYARNNQPGVAPQNNTSPSQIGFTANFLANQTFAGPPRITLSNRGIVLGNTIQGPQARVTENFQIQDAVSFATGNHRFKFGFDGTKYKQDQIFLFINQGILNFSRTAQNGTGDDFADFLIGNTPSSIQFGANGERDFRQDQGSLFAQDTWRVSNSMTLSLGVRYEYTSPLTDKGNRAAFYRPGAISQLLTSGQLRTPEGTLISVPAGRRAPVGLVFVGDPDPVLGGTVTPGGVAKDLNNFAPRLGIAYSPKVSSDGFMRTLLGDDDTVIRAGFGVYYGAIVGNNVLQQLSAPGFNGTSSFFSPSSGTLANPFGPDPNPTFCQGTNCVRNLPQIANPFEASTVNVFAPLSQFSRATDPNIRTPYTYQYNFTVERGFGKNFVANLAYVGSRGVKLYALEQVNPALGTFFATPAGRTIPTPSSVNANSRRNNPDIALGISQAITAGNSYYNSLQAGLQKRLSGGLSFQLAYTYSKLISDSDAIDETLDLLDRRFTRGLSPNDVPHRFVASYLYDLQFAKGYSGFAKTMLDGFSFGGITTFQSGTPFTVGNIFDTVGTGGGVFSFADVGAPFQRFDPRQSDSRAFNPDAFRAFGDPNAGFNIATQFRRGTQGYNQYRAKNGINNFDLIVAKKTAIGERANLELGVEAFNAFNHAQFTTLNTNLNNIVRNTDGSIDLNRTSFGKYTATREARVVQIRARLNF